MKKSKTNNVSNEVVLDVVELDTLIDERDLQSPSFGSLEGRDLQSPSFGSLEGRDLKGTVGSLEGMDLQSPSFGSLEGRDLKGTVGSLKGRDLKYAEANTYGSLNLNECIICLEILDSSQNEVIVSKNALFESSSGNEYYLNCICNIHIHKKCMMDWMKQLKKCPICLTALHKFERWLIIRKLGIIIIATGAFMCIVLTFMNMIDPILIYYQSKRFYTFSH